MSFFPKWSARRDSVDIGLNMSCSGSSAPTLNTTDIPVTVARTGTGVYTITVTSNDLKIKALKSAICKAFASTAEYGVKVGTWSGGVLTITTYNSGSAADLTGDIHVHIILGA